MRYPIAAYHSTLVYISQPACSFTNLSDSLSDLTDYIASTRRWDSSQFRRAPQGSVHRSILAACSLL